MTNFIFIFVLIAVAAVGIPLYLKKRKKKAMQVPVSERQNKDEVWKTIKQFLKDNNEYGKEIIDSYVAKRNGIDYINPNDSTYSKKQKKAENKIREMQYKTAKKAGIKNSRPNERDLYVVCFSTMNTKTRTVDNSRAIECEVINSKIDKKNWDRKIVINGELDYNREMEWIAPIKAAEEIKVSKVEQKKKESAAKRQNKKLNKEKKNNAKK